MLKPPTYAKSQHSNFLIFPISCPDISHSPNLADFGMMTLIIPAMHPTVIQNTPHRRQAGLVKEQHKNQKITSNHYFPLTHSFLIVLVMIFLITCYGSPAPPSLHLFFLKYLSKYLLIFLCFDRFPTLKSQG